MSTFLVFGASGSVGQAVLARLGARGERVHAVSREPAPTAVAAQLAWIRGDLYGEVAVAGTIDVVLSLGPLDAFAAWFERSAPAAVRRVVALSSMSAQSKQASDDPAERELAARLAAAEERLAGAAQARGVAWTVLRPTLIYGGGSDRSLAPIARFMRRWRVAPVPFGADGLRQPVHVDDLAVAVLAAVELDAAAGQIYPLGGGERLRFDDLVRRLRAAVPGFVLPLPLPLFALRLIARSMRSGAGRANAFSETAVRRLRSPLIADNSAAARDLGYAPRAFVANDVLPARRIDENA